MRTVVPQVFRSDFACFRGLVTSDHSLKTAEDEVTASLQQLVTFDSISGIAGTEHVTFKNSLSALKVDLRFQNPKLGALLPFHACG